MPSVAGWAPRHAARGRLCFRIGKILQFVGNPDWFERKNVSTAHACRSGGIVKPRFAHKRRITAVVRKNRTTAINRNLSPVERSYLEIIQTVSRIAKRKARAGGK